MSILDDILDVLGIGGGSLEHIQAMARSVRPEEIEAMAPVFDHGTQVFNTGHGHLESAIDNVVTGWKGDAARAASTTVLNGAMTSRSSAEDSSTAASNVRSYAAQVRTAQQQILAVQPVDTSFGHAVQASGGPVAAALNPGAVATNLAAAQVKKEQHREQAAQYLSQMNDEGEQFAAQQSATFTPVPPPPGYSDQLPSTISVHAPSGSGGGGGPMPTVPAPPGGPGGSTWSPPGSPSGPIAPVHHPYQNPGRPGTGPTNPPTNGPTNPPTNSPGGPTTPPPTPGGSTTVQGANPPTEVTPSGPPVALPDPTGSGTGVGIGTAAVLGGGAAAIAAGGVAGLNRGGWPGGRALAGAGEPGGLGTGRGGVGDGLAERGFARGSGFGGAADEVPGRFGSGAGSAMGGLDPDEAALRAGRLSAATAGELAAGERGMMPPMGGAGARRSDDEELDKRPDYLVETDDVWGDGRLAAPPVLG